MAQSKLLQLSPQALFRYQLVSAVQTRVLAGIALSEAIRDVIALPHPDAWGRLREVSERTLYRWLDAYQQQGVEGLEPAQRTRIADSAVLPVELLNFLRVEKKADPEASVPELIRRARWRGLLAEDETMSRVSVWRACRRMGLPLVRVCKPIDQDMRAWSYPHRMFMVLADTASISAPASTACAESPCTLSTTLHASASPPPWTPPKTRRSSCAAYIKRSPAGA